jgi:hypothetical protein
VADRDLNAMNDLPNTAGKLTRARYDSCPRSCGKVPFEAGLLDVPGPAQQLRGRILIRLLAPPSA